MIRRIQEEDIESIQSMVYHAWEKESDVDSLTKGYIYPMLVRYYKKDFEYSYLVDNEGIDAFLFASIGEKKNTKEYILQRIEELSLEQQAFVYDYYRYLEYNQRQLDEYIDSRTMVLGLLASQKGGMGRLLMKNIEAISQRIGMESMILWADETCNYSYYESLGYSLVKVFDSVLFDKNIKTFIYRKECAK